MFDQHYSPDEGMILVFSAIGALFAWIRWYYLLWAVGPRLQRREGRSLPAWTPLVCGGLLYWVLRQWSAEDVRTSGAYLLFYMVLGACWLGLFRGVLPLFGLSLRDDVIERGNKAAGLALSGALVGGACCFAGGNVGNGPGWWVVLFAALLGTLPLLGLWWLVNLCSGLAERVTLERDAAAGLRAAGFFIGAGLILGRAVAGDWVSATATLEEFVRMAWPAAVLTAVVVGIERSCRPTADHGVASLISVGGSPALAYIGAGLVAILALGR